ncbi:Aldo/keto reductase [Atractiella rhizophila]|nr:Aldo/keto reductase [Atractiella rhizophila]
MGLGVYELYSSECYNAVLCALKAGYRLIDSAEWYDNEAECGKAIKKYMKDSGVAREDIYYTTKLRSNSTYAHATKEIQRSLRTCGLGYIDLYLIHSPLGGDTVRRETWKALEDAKSRGEVRSIGVSNFGERHLRELIEGGIKERIAVNQVDLHPFMTRNSLVSYCRSQGIALQAWAPLVRGLKMRHPLLLSLSQKHGKTPAQILVRYSLQKGFISIPKSARENRIKENAEVFDFQLAEEEVEDLDGCDEYLVTDWDPTDCP